jgi:hypothetical protein
MTRTETCDNSFDPASNNRSGCFRHGQQVEAPARGGGDLGKSAQNEPVLDRRGNVPFLYGFPSVTISTCTKVRTFEITDDKILPGGRVTPSRGQ